MFNKKLISTVLSALTIFPTVAPLVSANGSQADEQPSTPVSDAADTDTKANGSLQKSNSTDKCAITSFSDQNTLCTPAPLSLSGEGLPELTYNFEQTYETSPEIEYNFGKTPLVGPLASLTPKSPSTITAQKDPQPKSPTQVAEHDDDDNVQTTPAQKDTQPKSPTQVAEHDDDDTAQTTPAQKRPHPAERQSDTLNNADDEDMQCPPSKRPSFSFSTDPLLRDVQIHLDSIDQLVDGFLNAIKSKSVVVSIISSTRSSFMSNLYTCLGNLIVSLKKMHQEIDPRHTEFAILQKNVNNTLKDLHIKILKVLIHDCTRPASVAPSYAYTKEHILKGTDLFDPGKNLSTLCDSDTLKNNIPIQIKNIITIATHPQKGFCFSEIMWYLYLNFLINITMQNIRIYFMENQWQEIAETDNLTTEFARKHLTDTLSSKIQSIHSTLSSTPGATYPIEPHDIAHINRFLDLELLDPNFYAPPYDEFSEMLQNAFILFQNPLIPNLKTFISNFCPGMIGRYLHFCYFHPPTYDIYKNQYYRRDEAYELKCINIKFLSETLKMNFEKIPELKKAFSRIFKDERVAFDLNGSLHDYREKKITERISKSKATYLINHPDLHIRLYKLSVLTEFLLYIQDTTNKYTSLPPLLRDFVAQLNTSDISRTHKNSSIGISLRDKDFSPFLYLSEFFDDLAEPTKQSTIPVLLDY